MNLTAENLLLIGSVILFFSLFWERVTKRFEVPVLILFLAIGMLASSENVGKIYFDDSETAQFIGMIALAIILFSGGMEAKYREIKPIVVPSILLATLGVLLTTFFIGGFIFLITNYLFVKFQLTLLESFLLASIIASTDFALVFGILRSKGLKLKHNLRPLLEFESGSNDVMAYLLLITFLQLVQHQSSGGAMIAGSFFYALIVGALCGFLLGRLAVRIINKVNMTNDALYPILLLAMAFILFLFTDLIGGSGFLAVYIGGLTVGNSRFVHKRSSLHFFDGFAWLAQILMFFTFGMLVNPAELLPVAMLGIVIGLFMILFARPLAVWGSIGFFKKIPAKAKFYVSWVGLRGAVPLIFATYVLAADIENGRIMFNIVFFIMLVSLLVQGTTVPFVAKLLKLDSDSHADKQVSASDAELSEDIKQAITEITVKKEHLQHGNTLMAMKIPENTLIVMVRRDDSYLIPKGSTEIQEGDILLMISDNEEAMRETYKKMNLR